MSAPRVYFTSALIPESYPTVYVYLFSTIFYCRVVTASALMSLLCCFSQWELSSYTRTTMGFEVDQFLGEVDGSGPAPFVREYQKIHTRYATANIPTAEPASRSGYHKRQHVP
jgi:hypothetical protein